MDGAPPPPDLLAFPAAVASLAEAGLLPPDEIEGYAVFGLLGPGGGLVRTPGVLPAALAASAARLGFVCPAVQAAEAAWAVGIEILPAPDLLALLNHFRGSQVVTPPRVGSGGLLEAHAAPDLSNMPGLETAKRGLEIAAAAGLGLLVVSPSAATRDGLAEAFTGILPDLSSAEAQEVAVVRSFAAAQNAAAMPSRPPVARLGQPFPGPGEARAPGPMAMAHRGVLLIEEAGRLQAEAAAILSAAHSAGEACGFPAAFRLVATASPCPCLGGPHGRGRIRAEACGPGCVRDVARRLPPVVLVQAWPENAVPGAGEPSVAVASRVVAATGRRNARLGRRLDVCPEAGRLFERAGSHATLGAMLRVAEAVADLERRPCVDASAAAEALAYAG